MQNFNLKWNKLIKKYIIKGLIIVSVENVDPYHPDKNIKVGEY